MDAVSIFSLPNLRLEKCRNKESKEMKKNARRGKID
jgi:hypothetical protein